MKRQAPESFVCWGCCLARSRRLWAAVGKPGKETCRKRGAVSVWGALMDGVLYSDDFFSTFVSRVVTKAAH